MTVKSYHTENYPEKAIIKTEVLN